MSGHNKVAIITGAGSGVGRAVAIAFLKDGYRTVLAGRRDEALEETITLSGAAAAQALAVSTDVTDQASVQNLFAADEAGLRPARRAVQQCRRQCAGRDHAGGSFARRSGRRWSTPT